MTTPPPPDLPLMEPEAEHVPRDSRLRRVPAWVLQGLIRSLPFALICVFVGSFGGLAIVAGLQAAQAGLEQRVRRLPLVARWVSALLLFAPLIAFACVGFVAQVGYGAAAGSGSLEAFQVALRSLESFEDWGSWTALGLIGGSLLCLSGTRIRLLPALGTGLLIALFLAATVLLAAVEPDWLPLMILPVGCGAGVMADAVEAWVEWGIRQHEGRKSSLDEISKELALAIACGYPAWSDPDEHLAELQERLERTSAELRALRADLARDPDREPEA